MRLTDQAVQPLRLRLECRPGQGAFLLDGPVNLPDLPHDPLAEPVQVLGLRGELVDGWLVRLGDERPWRQPGGHRPASDPDAGFGPGVDDHRPPGTPQQLAHGPDQLRPTGA
jgi:hypothetical protein